ncbi:DNA polymerase beta superfamily protein [Peribacillus glennii]|nr:nucleotidyltransferase domain-containing protein [Peribacillus glennii]
MEKENGVEIWMAAETGSHSFGLQTPESDRDIRFVFMQKNMRDYLSLKAKHEVITFKNAEFEIEGWDIFKAFRLMQKSNPGMFEWFHSRTIDISNHKFVCEIKELIQTHYSKRTLGLHYFNMCRTNLAYLKKIAVMEKKAHKTMVQVARCYLMLLVLLQKRRLPPLHIDELLNGASMNSAIRYSIEELFRLKKQNRYLSGKALMDTSVLLEEELIAIQSMLSGLPEGKGMEGELNELAWKCLGI